MSKIASHLVVLAVGMAMGLGAVAIAQNQVRPTAEAASDAAIVRQLKTGNRALRDITRRLGANYQDTTLLGMTGDGFHNLHMDVVETCNALNRAISGTSVGCPSFVTP